MPFQLTPIVAEGDTPSNKRLLIAYTPLNLRQDNIYKAQLKSGTLQNIFTENLTVSYWRTL